MSTQWKELRQVGVGRAGTHLWPSLLRQALSVSSKTRFQSRKPEKVGWLPKGDQHSQLSGGRLGSSPSAHLVWAWVGGWGLPTLPHPRRGPHLPSSRQAAMTRGAVWLVLAAGSSGGKRNLA